MKMLKSLLKRTHSLPVHGWFGIIIMAGAQALVTLDVHFVLVWLTPIMWTGYILAVDGFVFRLRGESWLTTRRREFPFLILMSIAVWLVFEIYNFHLRNWIYLGVPANPHLRNWAYLWSFATIMPGVFETAEITGFLLQRLNLGKRLSIRLPTGPAWLWFCIGLSALVIPLALPANMAAFLFGFIWIGFIFFLDPINERFAQFSFRTAWSDGNLSTTHSLLAAGFLCGLIWETWNYQAAIGNGGHWVYTIPEPLRIFGWHFGKMPVLGLLGFPPFALELRSMYTLLRTLFKIDRFLEPKRLVQ